MIKVKRHRDGKVFTNDMSADEGIYEIHFCTSYAQVKVQELEDDYLQCKEIICQPVGSVPSWVDMLAVQNDDTGEFID